jgi:hypothetical protein
MTTLSRHAGAVSTTRRHHRGAAVCATLDSYRAPASYPCTASYGNSWPGPAPLAELHPGGRADLEDAVAGLGLEQFEHLGHEVGAPRGGDGGAVVGAFGHEGPGCVGRLEVDVGQEQVAGHGPEGVLDPRGAEGLAAADVVGQGRARLCGLGWRGVGEHCADCPSGLGEEDDGVDEAGGGDVGGRQAGADFGAGGA